LRNSSTWFAKDDHVLFERQPRDLDIAGHRNSLQNQGGLVGDRERLDGRQRVFDHLPPNLYSHKSSVTRDGPDMLLPKASRSWAR
jgi:hypothetical protein